MLRDWNKVAHHCCTAVWRYTSPSCRYTDCWVFFPPLPAVWRRDRQVVKSIIDGRGGFFSQFGDAWDRGDRDEEPRPNAVYAHDPVLIPEQARTNMAACTTTERGGRRGRRFGPASVLLGFFRAAAVDRSSCHHNTFPVKQEIFFPVLSF